MEFRLLDGREVVLRRYDASKNKAGRVTPESFDGYTLPDFSPLTRTQKQELIDIHNMRLELKLLVLHLEPEQDEFSLRMHVLRRNSGR
jgi:hypothetical protein